MIGASFTVFFALAVIALTGLLSLSVLILWVRGRLRL